MEERELTDFERRALLIRAHLKPDLRYDLSLIPDPFIIEFAGPASSGKSTVIREVYKLFKRQGYRVRKPEEGPEVVNYIPRTTPEYNIRTGHYSVALLMDFSWGHQNDLVLLERGAFDPYCWMEYWFRKGKLTEGQMRELQNHFLMDFFTKKIDVAFFFVCESSVAIARETRFEIVKTLGQTTNPETIDLLNEIYKDAYQRLVPKYPQLSLVDTTRLSEVEMVKLVADAILDTLEKKVIAASS